MTKDEILFFDNLAVSWDRNEVKSTEAKVKDILSLSGLRDGMDYLDLGTGTGVLIPYLSRAAGSTGKVTAVDISEGMLTKAREKFGHLSNVTFLKQDFEEAPLNGKYDIIFLYCVYPHLHKPADTLKLLKKNNLKENGRIIIAFPSDECFINNIHRERKAESDLLPSAPLLSNRIKEWGLNSEVIAYNPEIYIVAVK